MRQFESELSDQQVVLFGSRAEGTSQERSDFDIGIIGNQPLPLDVFYRIDDFLKSLPTLYTIDWVDLNRSEKSFRAQALQHAEVIFGQANPAA